MTVAATWLSGRAMFAVGVTRFRALAIFTLTPTFSGSLRRRTAQELVAGKHRHITRRHVQGMRTRSKGGPCSGLIARAFWEGSDALSGELIARGSDGEGKGGGEDGLATRGLVNPG